MYLRRAGERVPQQQKERKEEGEGEARLHALPAVHLLDVGEAVDLALALALLCLFIIRVEHQRHVPQDEFSLKLAHTQPVISTNPPRLKGD